MICYILAMGKHLGPHVVVGYGIKIFWPGLLITLPDHLVDFEACFKVYNLVSVHLKSNKLGEMTNLNMIFHVVVSVCWSVKIWNLPEFPAQFWNGL